jgi:hypothetical protein
MQNNIDKRKIKQLNQISYTMAKTTALLVFVLLVTAIFNGDCVVDAAPSTLVWLNRCEILQTLCNADPDLCAEYHRLCGPLQTTEAKTGNLKAENLP